MQIEIPKSRPALFGLGRTMSNGLSLHATSINLSLTKPANFQADYSAAVVAEDAFQSARNVRSTKIADRDTQEKEVDSFITRAKNILKSDTEFGSKWNVAWTQVGFRNQSLKTPASLNGKLEVLRSLATFYSNNQGKQVPALRISYLDAGNLEAKLAAAINEVKNAEAELEAKRTARDGAEEGLRKRMRALINELNFLLDPLDSRWSGFGLNKPGETQRPEQVEGVQADISTPRHLRLTWEPSARASRYKTRIMVVGRDTSFRTAEEVFETHANLNTFTPGDTVRAEVIAVNGAGESSPSIAVEKQIS